MKWGREGETTEWGPHRKKGVERKFLRIKPIH